MKIDLHCHSKYSGDNHLEPEEVIRLAMERGLDGICFTEHHSVDASLPVEDIEIPKRFLVFRGVELSTDKGHLLVYGLKDDSWNRWSNSNYLNADEIIRVAHGLGAICVPAHPFRGWESFGEELLHMEGPDAVETHNGQNRPEDNKRAVQAAKLKGLPTTGGSDCHRLDQVGSAYTMFQDPVYTMEQIVEEIRKGKCYGKGGGL